MSRTKGAKDLQPRAQPEFRVITKPQGRPKGSKHSNPMPEHMIRPTMTIHIYAWLKELLHRKAYAPGENSSRYIESLILKDNPSWKAPQR